MSAVPEPANLADMVRARAKALGDAILYEFEGRQTSFAEFDRKTNRVANALKALGVKPRERIAYLGKNSDIYFELLMGAIKANVVMAPVNWRLAGPEVAFIVEDCKAPVLFVGPEFITQVRNIRAQIPSVRTIITTEGGAPEWPDYAAWRDAQSADDPKVEISRKDIAIQLYTSGTTGKPKGAMLSHANFLNLVEHRHGRKARLEQMDHRRRLAGGDADLPYRRFGLGRDGPLPRRQGRDRPRIRSDQGARLLRAVRHHQIVHGAGRDAVRGAPAPRAEVDFSKLKYMLYGASPIPAALLKECIEVFKCGFVQMYGMTETTGTIVALPPEDHIEGSDRMRSAGKALPGVELAILDANGNRLPPGEVGEIATRSGSNMAGYWNLPEATARTLGPTAGCAPATPATWTRTAISTSTTASRT